LSDWLIERGIGEDRAVRIAGGEIVDAQVFLHGTTRAGTRLTARLKTSRPRAIADSEGQEYLLPGVSGATEGAAIVIEVTREAIPGAEPWKRPLAKITDQSPGAPNPIAAKVLTFPAPTDVLGAAGWWDLLEEARTGVMQFPGGELRISVTPAMTLIDVDGYLPADELVVAGAAAAARTIRRLDIGGSIGIDLPTSGSKAARQAAAAAIDEGLSQPFERTAVNGFGFVQIVRPRARASLVELAQDRASFEARALLRRAAFEQPGPKRLVAHPSVIQTLERHPAWLDALANQAGGAIALRAEASLTISAGYAEAA
jgi:hypothetical protein